MLTVGIVEVHDLDNGRIAAMLVDKIVKVEIPVPVIHGNAGDFLQPGFPGVPVKIVRPGLRVYLIEPSRKKTSFLRNLIKKLSLHDIFVLRCRVEEYPCDKEDVPERFDVVTTRALYKIDEFVIKASPLCASNGTMIISKGPSVKQEINTVEAGRCKVIRPDLSRFGIDRYLISIKP